MEMRLYPFFAYATGPAEGLTLADIEVTILRITKSDKSMSTVVDAQAAQAEIGKGYYAYYYDAVEQLTYDYLPFIEYVGAEPVSPQFYGGDVLDLTVIAGMLGPGATAKTYTVNDGGGTPIPDVDVWVTTDLVGTHVIASGKTDALGQVTFWLDSGTVYIWRQKSGWDFPDNPDEETV